MVQNKTDASYESSVMQTIPDESKRPSKEIVINLTSDEEYKEAIVNEIHKMHMLQSLQALQYLKTLPVPPISSICNRLVFLPPPKIPNQKTLIFDMDETLIHCVDDIDDEDPQFIIKVPLDGEEVEAGINIRPYALECLEAVNQQFQVIVFTASHQSYADAVLDFLDPDGDLIQKRLYRDS